jgi:hypothetical protein
LRATPTGDEADWKAAMQDFIDAIGADEAVSGRNG